MRLAIRGLSWVLIAVGSLVALYFVYLLLFTNLTTERAQQGLRETWERERGAVEETLTAPDAASGAVDAVALGEAYAAVWFERPATGERVVHADPLYVVEGVTPEALRKGPGHYPDTAAPGEVGNLGIAGHRTTYGAPFYNLDELEPGDLVHVVDREGTRWVYTVREQRIVRPDDTWVIGDDPLGTGEPTLTLTTCHPRFSAAQRLVVFATLRSDA